MKRLFLFLITFVIPIVFCLPSKSDFGDADFPIGMFDGGPKSYHDAWCGKIGNKCRVIFNRLCNKCQNYSSRQPFLT